VRIRSLALVTIMNGSVARAPTFLKLYTPLKDRHLGGRKTFDDAGQRARTTGRPAMTIIVAEV
jgi:hypothetical protein